MATQQDYVEKSIKERIMLKNIFQKLTTEFDWKYYFTPEEGYDLYDAVLMKFEKGTGNILNRYFVESKIRDTHYPTLLLEYKKMSDLKAEVKRLDNKTNKECFTNIKSSIVYLTVTPDGSYWFNLDKLEVDMIDWQEEMHWASTTDKGKGKILKKVTYLDINTAKYINVKPQDEVNNDVKVIERVMLIHKQTSNLYRTLFC